MIIEDTQQQQLLNKYNKVRQKAVKKKLMLVSALNMTTFLCFVFAMSFYQWVYVELDVSKNNLDSKAHRYWVNLLYVKQDVVGSSYQYFQSAENRACHNNIYCSAVFFQLHFIGILCFCIFSIAVLVQLVEFCRMIYYAFTLGKIIHTRKKFRHVVSISTYIIGLSINLFAYQVMDYIQFKLGFCYWLCVGIVFVFIMIIVYGQISLQKMVKQAMIQNLLDLQKNVRHEKMRIQSNIEDVKSISQQKITL